ncbi:hypothetical protein BH11PSE8_BH11PSE8_34520 [soil metagenome]
MKTKSPDAKPAAITPEQRKNNARLAVALGVTAVVIFVGFIVKSAVFGM